MKDAVRCTCQSGRINACGLLSDYSAPWNKHATVLAVLYNLFVFECLQNLHENGVRGIKFNPFRVILGSSRLVLIPRFLQYPGYSLSATMKNSFLSSDDESAFKKARTSDDRQYVRIKFEDIPNFLHDGAFYKTLKEGHEDDSAVDVPSHCFCYTEEVCSLQDFEQFLRVMAFWGLSTLPECLIKFCCDNDVHGWSESIDQTSSELTFAHDLRSIFELGLEEALPAAIKLGKSEVVDYLAKGEIRTEKGTFAAAQCGRVDYLVLLHHHGHPWDKAACAAAAEGGYLDCLQFLHEHGCEWDQHVYTNAAFRQR